MSTWVQVRCHGVPMRIPASCCWLTPSGLVWDCRQCGPSFQEIPAALWPVKKDIHDAGGRLVGDDLWGPDGVLRMPLEAPEVDRTAYQLWSCLDVTGQFFREVAA